MKVAIFGGGVAGLSAAHELINRNFEVEVFEASAVPGGKARSAGVAGTGINGRRDLPCEHGFRFFPRFYKHVIATMREIPLQDNKGSVADNLVETEGIRLARFDKPSVSLPARFPRSLKELKKILNARLANTLGLSDEDKNDFALKIWQLMTSCEDRRKNEYERISWWEFTDADNHSEAYQSIFVKGLTRTLVAARAEKASTKTGGDIFLQLIFDIARPGISSDRILNGPTNQAWIDPWMEYLQKKGVKFHFNSPLKSFNANKESVVSAIVLNENREYKIQADYYLSALPVEAMAKVINADLLKIDPTLESIITLSKDVSWMNGSQFFLTEDIEICKGHSIYIDTPWALTSISQKQFWPNFNLENYGDGKVKGILSIDISDWDSPGIIYNKPARECTKDEIIEEIWAQLKKSLNIDGVEVLKDSYIHHSYVDSDIEFETVKVNKEPLLVNTINSWDQRPFAYTRIRNLFLASDYVKTYTDLATMEGANEAARRAVNCIIDASGVKKKKCKLWNLHQPIVFSILRSRDARRYRKGLPWNGRLPVILEILQTFIVFFKKIF
ncbi:MAG: hydroxysqualene dehydroxylase [Bacteroidia bacterium]